MALLVIPTRNDVYSYTQRMNLNGVVYTLTLNYNLRTDVWYLDISDAAGNVLLAGIALLQGLPLTWNFFDRIPGLPPGDLVLIDETGGSLDPSKKTLGIDVKLEYLEA